MSYPAEHFAFLEGLVQAFPYTFNIGTQRFGNCTSTTYQLIMNPHNPFASRPYRLSKKDSEVVDTQVKEMIEKGVIEPSSSPYRNPIFVLYKKDGSGRFILDARKINSYLQPDRYPLPYIRDLLDLLKGAKYFSHLDLISGYWQVTLHPDDRPKTAFATKDGLYQFVVMPFGVATAPSAFQRMIQDVLHPLLARGVLVYIDDLVIYSDTLEEHYRIFAEVIRLLAAANLRVKPSKCLLFQTSLPFLGHVVDENGIHMDPDKVLAFKNYVKPTSRTTLQRFLGSCNYYHSYVKDFAAIASPLYNLLTKNVPWVWADEHDKAFTALILALTSASFLIQPDYSLPFIIVTDASRQGIGGYLAQSSTFQPTSAVNCSLPDDLRIVAYCSRRLSKAERNYSVTELEASGVLYALSKFRAYVLGHATHIFSDHSALVNISVNADPVSPRLLRFVERIMPYSPRLYYIRGVTNTLADALSRMYDLSEGEEDVVHERAEHTERIMAIKTDPLAQELLIEQEHDSFIKGVKKKLDKFPDFLLIDDVLYHRSLIAGQSILRIVVPITFRGRILEAYHDTFSGHQGVFRTFNNLRTKYYWPGYHQDVVKYIRTCITCQQADKQRNRITVLVMQIPIVDIFETMGIDVMGPLPETERHHRFLVVVVDHATKWVEAFPTKDVTATTIAELLYSNIICRFGPPKTLHSDRGTNFLSKNVICFLSRRRTLLPTTQSVMVK